MRKDSSEAVTHLRLNLREVRPVLQLPRCIGDGSKQGSLPADPLTLTCAGPHSSIRWDGCRHQIVPAGSLCAVWRCLTGEQRSRTYWQESKHAQWTKRNHDQTALLLLEVHGDYPTWRCVSLLLLISYNEWKHSCHISGSGSWYRVCWMILWFEIVLLLYSYAPFTTNDFCHFSLVLLLLSALQSFLFLPLSPCFGSDSEIVLHHSLLPDTLMHPPPVKHAHARAHTRTHMHEYPKELIVYYFLHTLQKVGIECTQFYFVKSLQKTPKTSGSKFIFQ